MQVERWFRFGRIGALAAFAAWLLSEPLAFTANQHGLRVGTAQFTYGLLGGFVSAALVFGFASERMERRAAIRRALIGFIVGALWVAGFDALSDFLSIQIVRAKPNSVDALAGIAFLWQMLVSMGLALAAGLVSSPSATRAKRMLVGGLITGVLSFVWHMTGSEILSIIDFARIGKLSNTFLPFSVGRLSDHAMMAFLLGTLVASAESVFADAFVKWFDEDGDKHEVALTAVVNRIGSSPAAEIAIIGDSAVAPVHAAILFDQGQYYLADAKTPAGTWVEGERIRRIIIEDGDRFMVGSTSIEFVRHGSVVPADQPTTTGRTTHLIIDAFETEFTLTPGINSIGSAAGSVIKVTYDATIEPVHVRIEVDGNTARATSDKVATLNDEPLTDWVALADGDRITCGQSSFTYRVRRRA